MGLDPGLGFLHFDTAARDSLACDLMEPVRPQVDAYLFDWISRETLKREWPFERHDGNCRLMAPFATRLVETVEISRQAVAPYTEWVAHARVTIGSTRKEATPTPLTNCRIREARTARHSFARRRARRAGPVTPPCGWPRSGCRQESGGGDPVREVDNGGVPRSRSGHWEILSGPARPAAVWGPAPSASTPRRTQIGMPIIDY